MKRILRIDDRRVDELFLLFQFFLEKVCVNLKVLQRRLDSLVNLVLKKLNYIPMQVHIFGSALVPLLEHLVVFFLFLKWNLEKHTILVITHFLLISLKVLFWSWLGKMCLVDFLLLFLFVWNNSIHFVALLMLSDILLKTCHLSCHLSSILFLGILLFDRWRLFIRSWIVLFLLLRLESWCIEPILNWRS